MIILNENIRLSDGRDGVIVSDDVYLGTWGLNPIIELEAPVHLGKAQIDCGRIGAFTQINMWDTASNTAECFIDCQSIGRYCSIARGVNVGLAGHSTSFLSSSTLFKFNKNADEFTPYIKHRNLEWEKEMKEKNLLSWKKPLPVIGNDVWIGMGATILNGVTIGDGAVIAAGSMVTRNIPPYEIWGGVPAKQIKKRFDEKIIKRLIKAKWWEYEPDLLVGLDLSNIELCIDDLEERIAIYSNREYKEPCISIDVLNGAISEKMA